MASMNTIIDGIGSAIAQDSTIDTWADGIYDTGVSVSEDWDDRKVPRAEDCPLVIIWPDAKAGGESESPKGLVINFCCMVHDPEKVTTAQGVIRHYGGRRVETLREYVFDVIESWIKDNATDLHIAHVLVDYSELKYFPFFSLIMEITLEEPKTIGGPMGGPFE